MDFSNGVVGEHSICVEGAGATRAGAYRRANVGISNEKTSENLVRRKSKVS